MLTSASFPVNVFGEDELAAIESTMFRVLSQVGIAVKSEALLARLRSKGYRAALDRVRLEPARVREYLEDDRARSRRQAGCAAEPAAEMPFELRVNDYIQNLHDPESDAIRPFTMASLIEQTRLVDVLHDRGVASSPPGLPADVPPAYQPVHQYWVAASYSRQGRVPMDAKTLESYPHVREMAQALGHPVEDLSVWVVSPLTLGGESVEMVLRHSGGLRSVRAANMASVGNTLPIHIGDAFAVSLAEVIGSAVLLREALPPEIEVVWSSGFNPTDFATGSMVLGSPEYMLLLMLRDQVNSYMHRASWKPRFHGGLWSMAKLPGAQACAEKSSMMTLASLFGQRRFSFAGALSLDEVYSPEQLMYDLEIKDHAARLIQGFDDSCDADRCLADVEQALREGGFIGLQTTADLFREAYWDPGLFERAALGNWRMLGGPTLRERAGRLVKQALVRHDYRLERGLQRCIDSILRVARREAGLPEALELPASAVGLPR